MAEEQKEQLKIDNIEVIVQFSDGTIHQIFLTNYQKLVILGNISNNTIKISENELFGIKIQHLNEKLDINVNVKK